MVERLGVKPRDVFQPVRVAIAGTTVSPGIFETPCRCWAARRRLPASMRRSQNGLGSLNGGTQPFARRLPIGSMAPCSSEADAGSKPQRTQLRGDAGAAQPAVRQHNEGHGRRLTAAFEALEAFPALAESRKRVLRVVREDQPSVAEMVAAIESDVALVIAVMRLANSAPTRAGKVARHPRGDRGAHARRASRR